jgi:anti-anti-sigma factor
MLLFRMAGDLHLATIGRLLSALDRVDLDRTTLLVFDLHDVAFIDLAGLTTILRANDDCADHAVHFPVVKPIGFASRVFTLTRVHRALDLIDPAALEQHTDSYSRLESPRAPGAPANRTGGRAFGLRPRSCSAHSS